MDKHEGGLETSELPQQWRPLVSRSTPPFCFFFRGLIFPVVGSVRISSGILSAGDASASAGGRRARRHAAPVHASQVGGPRAGRQVGRQAGRGDEEPSTSWAPRLEALPREYGGRRS